MDSAAWGFIGTIVGAAVSVATTWLASRSAAHLQEKADSQQRAERARAFQRETLLALQETLQHAMRALGRAVHEDYMAERKGATWGATLLPEELSEELRVTNTRVWALTERVADDGLRAALSAFQLKLAWPAFAASRGEAESKMNELVGLYRDVMTQLGHVLRATY